MAFPKLAAAVKRYVVNNEDLGEAKWSGVVSRAEFSGDVSQDDIRPGDEWTLRLINALVEVSRKDEGLLHEDIGEAYLFYVLDHPKWSERFALLAPDILGFVSNLDNLFHYLHMNVFNTEGDCPAFRLEDEVDDKKKFTGNKEIHYYSRHKGYSKIAFGFIRAALRRHYLDTKTVMQFRSVDVERIGKQPFEHAVFLMLGKGKRTKKEKPPKFVAETEKGAEGQLDKATVQGIMEAIKTGNVTKSRKFWAMIKTAMAFGALVDKFEPLYPKRLLITPQLFCDAFPYHMAFDKNLNVKHVGVGLQRMLPSLRLGDCALESALELVHPPVDPLTPHTVRLFPNQLFRFRVRPECLPAHWRSDPLLQLRGQFIQVDGGKSFLFLGSPAVESLAEIRERHFHFGEIALHDKTRDLAFDDRQAGDGPIAVKDGAEIIQQLRLEIIELERELEEERKKPPQIVEKRVEVPTVVPAVLPLNGLSNQELDDLRARLAKTEGELGDANDRCLQISSSMLPHYLAQQWIDLGYRLNFTSGVYEEVTILFADVVQFSQICNQCKPDVVCNVLNSLYRALDRLTFVHDLFKVEYIGDAYVCCGGLPIPLDSHAERTCNMALGIMAASREILSPVTNESVKLRIGIHTGPVITGIIGEKIPRFCVYGSTLTLASRMESHGLLGKIQISPATKARIDGKGFNVVDRGEIEVRGVGTMFTFFLEGSAKSPAELLGKAGSKSRAVPVNAGGSNFFYDKNLSMADYTDNLLEGQPVPSNPLMYKGVGKATGRITRQKTLAQVELKKGKSLVRNGVGH